MTEKVKFFNPNDGITGRDGGPYLDIEEARRQEEYSARAEGREPDYSDLHHIGIPEKAERDILDRRFIVQSQDTDDVEDKIEKHLEEGAMTVVEPTPVEPEAWTPPAANEGENPPKDNDPIDDIFDEDDSDKKNA